MERDISEEIAVDGTGQERLDPRVRLTRTAIREAMLELLARQPIEHITIRAITAKAGVGYNTFFRHYPDKDAVLADLGDEEIKRVLELAVPILTSKSAYAAHLELCENVNRRHRLWSALLAGAGPSVKATFVEHSLELSKREHPQAHWLPLDFMMTVTVTLILETLTWWLKQKQRDSPEQIAAILDRLLRRVLAEPRRGDRAPR
jgi:AcrR family transcriptional regulator